MAGKLEIKLIKSMIGRPRKHRRILEGIGLRKVNKTVELDNTETIRGMVQHVSHLVKVKEINNET